VTEASLSWLDLTAADRDKVRRVLDLFSEQGTVDEIGLGSLRDTISNALFPGTSVLHHPAAVRAIHFADLSVTGILGTGLQRGARCTRSGNAADIR
jgi:hypothetical protein